MTVELHNLRVAAASFCVLALPFSAAGFTAAGQRNEALFGFVVCSFFLLWVWLYLYYLRYLAAKIDESGVTNPAFFNERGPAISWSELDSMAIKQYPFVRCLGRATLFSWKSAPVFPAPWLIANLDQVNQAIEAASQAHQRDFSHLLGLRP